VATNTAHHAIHLVPGPECTDTFAHSHNDPCEINAKDSRQLLACMRRGAGANLRIERIDASSANSHQNLARPGHGPRQRHHPKICARRFDHRGEHG
jgi:hypothetical protein